MYIHVHVYYYMYMYLQFKGSATFLRDFDPMVATNQTHIQSNREESY